MDYSLIELLAFGLIQLGLGGCVGWWLRGLHLSVVGVMPLTPVEQPHVAETVWEVTPHVPKESTHGRELTTSPFVMCLFVDRKGEVVARKRLRRESVTDPILWNGKNYELVADSPVGRRYRQVA